MQLQWWCAALGEPWTWTWRAYPGVWVFTAFVVFLRRVLTGRGQWSAAPTRERAAFIAGVVSLWASLDWPLGPVAAGYLASAHALQFLIVTMISAPLLLVGARTGAAARLARMDLDTTSTKWSHHRILETFGRGEADILDGANHGFAVIGGPAYHEGAAKVAYDKTLTKFAKALD